MSYIRCIKKETYDKYSFLNDHFPKQSGGQSCQETGFGVSDGKIFDGVAEVQSMNGNLDIATLITETGDVYVNLSSMDRERFYLGISKVTPSFRVSQTNAQAFIQEMLGEEALTAKACKEITSDDPWLLAKYGNYSKAEQLLKKAIADSPKNNSRDLGEAKNNLAWLYVTAKNKEFLKLKEAIRLAKEGIRDIEIQERSRRSDDDTIKLMAGEAYHTLATAYFLNGNYSEALQTINQVTNKWRPDISIPLREMIQKKLDK